MFVWCFSFGAVGCCLVVLGCVGVVVFVLLVSLVVLACTGFVWCCWVLVFVRIVVGLFGFGLGFVSGCGGFCLFVCLSFCQP